MMLRDSRGRRVSRHRVRVALILRLELQRRQGVLLAGPGAWPADLLGAVARTSGYRIDVVRRVYRWMHRTGAVIEAWALAVDGSLGAYIFAAEVPR